MPCGDGGDVGGLGGGDSGDDVGSVRPRAQAEGRIGGGGRRQKLRALRRGLSVLEKAIARGRVLVYAGHYSIPSICPASAGHFFVVANCCYQGSRGACAWRSQLSLPTPSLAFWPASACKKQSARGRYINEPLIAPLDPRHHPSIHPPINGSQAGRSLAWL